LRKDCSINSWRAKECSDYSLPTKAQVFSAVFTHWQFQTGSLFPYYQ
jgi:hypothetical protein